MMFSSSLARKMAAPVLLVAALTVAGCQTTGGTKQTVGTLGGAALGGLAGSQFGDGRGQLVATAAGALLGALVGAEVGSSLDKADQAALANTTAYTLETVPSGQPTRWNNPDSGRYGTVTAEPSYTNSYGQNCRNYRQTVEINGQTEIMTGTACRRPDGTWQPTN